MTLMSCKTKDSKKLMSPTLIGKFILGNKVFYDVGVD